MLTTTSTLLPKSYYMKNKWTLNLQGNSNGTAAAMVVHTCKPSLVFVYWDEFNKETTSVVFYSCRVHM